MTPLIVPVGQHTVGQLKIHREENQTLWSKGLKQSPIAETDSNVGVTGEENETKLRLKTKKGV